jgi:hypothetical protein
MIIHSPIKILFSKILQGVSLYSANTSVDGKTILLPMMNLWMLSKFCGNENNRRSKYFLS